MNRIKDIPLLIVEDNFIDLEYIQEVIQLISKNIEKQFAITLVNDLLSAKEALSKLESGAIVLVDLKLPDSRGIDTLISLKNSNPNVSYIVISGSPDVELIDAVRDLGSDFINKFDLNEMLQGILLKILKAN